MAIAAPPQRFINEAPISAVIAKFETAGRSGVLDWNRLLRQIHAAAELPGSFARAIASGPGGAPPELVGLLLAASRKLDRDFAQVLTGAYLTPIDCEDLLSMSSHLVRGVRLDARSTASMNASTADALIPVYVVMAGCWDDYAAMIPLVEDSARLTAVGKVACARRRSAVERLRVARMEAASGPLAPSQLLRLLEGFRRLEDVFGQLRTRSETC